LEEVNPQNGEVAYTLGLTYLKQKQYADAKKCLDICLRVDDSDVDAMMAMAQVCAGVGGAAAVEEASWYERIILQVPHHDGASSSSNKETVASAYCNLGILRPNQEIEYYQKALGIMPDHYQSRYSLGATYASTQQWEAAAEQFRWAVRLAAAAAKDDDNNKSIILALTSLYKVALNIVQIERHDSQTAMLQRMQEVMGNENYELLAATKTKAPR
jgi:tetratricopeptide (TPR) repeat protein